MKIAFTGHRPDKLPGGYNGDHSSIQAFIREELGKIPLSRVYVGGALGIDTIALQAAHYWTIGDIGVEIILCEPFKGFWRKWPIDTIEHYMYLKYSKNVNTITLDDSEEYKPWKMQRRNEYMVNNCDELWAWWDGSDGGTKNCIDYAKKKGVKIRNLYEEFKS